MLRVRVPITAKGADVKLFEIRGGKRVRIAVKKVRGGTVRFVVRDTSSKARTYQAYVGATARTHADWTPRRTVR